MMCRVHTGNVEDEVVKVVWCQIPKGIDFRNGYEVYSSISGVLGETPEEYSNRSEWCLENRDLLVCTGWIGKKTTDKEDN